jgi:hypothetical protein
MKGRLTFFRNSKIRLMACVMTFLTLGPPGAPRNDMIILLALLSETRREGNEREKLDLGRSLE